MSSRATRWRASRSTRAPLVSAGVASALVPSPVEAHAANVDRATSAAGRQDLGCMGANPNKRLMLRGHAQQSANDGLGRAPMADLPFLPDHTPSAVPIHALQSSEWRDWIESRPETLKRLAAAHDFQAQNARILL